MKLVKPVSERKLQELERELELQMERLKDSTANSVKKILKDASFAEWFQKHPIHSMVLFFMTGFIITGEIKKKIKSTQHTQAPQPTEPTRRHLRLSP